MIRRFGKVTAIVEKRIRIERTVLVIPVDTAIETIRARRRDDTNLGDPKAASSLDGIGRNTDLGRIIRDDRRVDSKREAIEMICNVDPILRDVRACTAKAARRWRIYAREDC